MQATIDRREVAVSQKENSIVQRIRDLDREKENLKILELNISNERVRMF